MTAKTTHQKTGAPFPRPPAALIWSTPEHVLAFGFGAGLAPRAPGTFGTLVGIPCLLLLLWLPWPAFVAATLALFVFGCFICGASARLLGVHDYGGIVFDEILGYLIAAAPLVWLRPDGIGGWIAGIVLAFVLFRIFDIAKPWPIRVFDRRVHGGFGIMVDDAIAGLFAAALLFGLRHWPLPF
ncbi:phosphatidylglycerophosphatase A family protein [Solimonas marina]|uniref:Phosphatidylglycerophosphatase A n=1 Tax=Solimonas marina TaxID=2714601 RepID=A0A969WEF2_9GAMM|nr:phosphatidylglycerophosphatase A [Solimonas marina]NKF24724.1 phosphatidylglycerophosphatase A [Solimonas marina]